MGSPWTAVLELAIAGGVTLLVLAPFAAWLFWLRGCQPLVRFAFLLPLTWLAPLLTATAWWLLSLEYSTAPIPLMWACLAAQVGASMLLVARLEGARLAAIFWVLVNLAIGLNADMAAAMAVTGIAI